MEPIQHKIYNAHGFQSRTYLDTYCDNKRGMPFEDEMLTQMEELHYFFKFANINGGTLIDISIGPIIYHLHSACEYFRDIILLRFNDQCILELRKWLHDRTGAFDWTHTSSFVTEKEGSGDQAQEKDLRLKEAIKHVLKCNTEGENITEPIKLPQADCLLIVYVLDTISKNEDDFINNLKKFSKLLKPGGQMLIYGVLNGTYFVVGEDKIHFFKYDENFIKKAVEGEGFVINHCHINTRKTENDLSDFKAIIFISARKN